MFPDRYSNTTEQMRKGPATNRFVIRIGEEKVLAVFARRKVKTQKARSFSIDWRIDLQKGLELVDRLYRDIFVNICFYSVFNRFVVVLANR